MSEPQNETSLFPDFTQELTAKVQSDLAQTLGQQTLNFIQANAAAAILGGRVEALDQRWGEVRKQVEELNAEITAMQQPLDLGKLDADVLVIELRNRGYSVTDPLTA